MSNLTSFPSTHSFLKHFPVNLYSLCADPLQNEKWYKEEMKREQGGGSLRQRAVPTPSTAHPHPALCYGGMIWSTGDLLCSCLTLLLLWEASPAQPFQRDAFLFSPSQRRIDWKTFVSREGEGLKGLLSFRHQPPPPHGYQAMLGRQPDSVVFTHNEE